MNNLDNKFFTMTASPHIKSQIKTHNLMGDVIISLVPALIWSIYVFGLRALTITSISVISCVIFEYLYRKLMNKSNSISDLSAVVTGILLAFCLPISVPLWIPVVGAFFAIIVVKQLYGGIGKNVVNPALAARVFLFIAYPSQVSAFTSAGNTKFNPFAISIEISDTIKAGATPLASLKEGLKPNDEVFSVLIGNTAGCIGEVSAVLLILGGIYLIVRKVITWHIPVAFLGTASIITLLFPTVHSISSVEFMLYELFTGGLILGAFFMATDYVTSPVTATGRVIYGIGCALITMFIRYFGGYPEGVSFAILIMNLFVWYIDKATKPKVFGGAKNNEKK